METNETFAQEAQAPPERIGFGTRLGAYLLDVVIAGAGGFAIGIFAGTALAALFFSTDMVEGTEEAEVMASGIVGILGGALGTVAGMMLIFLIIMLMEAFTGQTFGKMILGIKNGSDDGSSASIGALLTRALVRYIGTIMTVLAGITGVAMLSTVGSFGGFIVFIGFFFILGENKQGFHDMLAKTAVYNKSDLR